MPYNITLSNGTDLITGGLLDNTTDSVNSSLTLVGKNYKSYGLFLNQNFVRLMENFALSTAPTAPVSGQLWFNSTSKLLSVNVAATKGTLNAIWKTIAGMTISAGTPANAYTGELWYDTTEGQLNIYNGTSWRLIGPLSKTATGNTGAIPDTVTDAPPSTTYVVIKFYINDVLVGIWSKEEPFTSDVPGFPTIRKGLNLHNTLGHTFWGTSEVASSLFVNGVSVQGNAFIRNNTSGTINGSLVLTNDGGITFGAANDFVGNVVGGTVTLKNQTNNKDFVLSLKTDNNQTPFLRGNYQTGLTESFSHPTASSPALSFATKNYVDILSGSVNGTADFFGHVTPNANVTYTLGNVTNVWSNIFTQSASIGNVYATNTFATVSNIAQVYISADLTPITNETSNIGSLGMQFNAINARSAVLSTTLTIGSNLIVGGNSVTTNNSTIGANLAVVGNIIGSAVTAAVSTGTGALTLAGGAGITGNVYIGGILVTPMLTLPTSGNASIIGNLTPAANVSYTLGNTTNRWISIFSESMLVGNVTAANIATNKANVSIVYLNTDILPVANTTSNLGSSGMYFNTLHASTLSISTNAIVGGSANVGINLGVIGNVTTNGFSVILGNSSVSGNSTVGANLSVTGNTSITSSRPSTSVSTGALVVTGGVGITGNLNVNGLTNFNNNVTVTGNLVTSTMPIGTSNTHVATTAFVINNAVPTGSLLMWSTTAAPTGYVFCDGSAVSRTTYAALFAVIGTTFGSGNGSTTFNLPNYNNRTPVGAGGLYALGVTGGSKDANVVSHTHTLSGGNVSGTFVTGVSTTTSSPLPTGGAVTTITSVTTTTGSPSYSSPTVQTAGSSGTDANMQPYLAINFIIKT